MSSIPHHNWQQHLSVDVDSLVRDTTLYLLNRIGKRAENRIAKSKRRKRSCWVRPWLHRRYQLGAYDGLMVELANEDVPGYISFQRLAPELFGELLSKVGPLIQRQDTHMRKAISAGARLALTLRYLATGNKLLYIKIFKYYYKILCNFNSFSIIL